MAKEKVDTVRIEPERTHFRQLIAKNPNHFGNLDGATAKAALKWSSNPRYEQLACIGFNPDSDQLEAVVEIKLPFGYGGDLCLAGTHEYVRFWVDYGTGWQDAGVVGFNVHDIPDTADCAKTPTKPLHYAVGLKLDPNRKCCDTPSLPKVRAILSWDVVPPLSPNWLPVWGNRLEAHIQIKPSNKLVCLLEQVKSDVFDTLKLKPELVQQIVKPIPLPAPPPLELSELVKLYAPPHASKAEKLTVSPHRFGFADLHSALTLTAISPEFVEGKIAQWQGLGLDWAGALEVLDKTKGNVSYEELNCLALDPNREGLAATLTIKRPNGYSGDLCGAGSLEYVAFWADWEDKCEWTYLDTVKLSIHDINSIPADGLHYLAMLKVNLDPHRRPCKHPHLARIRAVLSWATPPSTTNPDEVPYWGNRLDAHVQIRPGKPVMQPEPIIRSLGSIPIAKIDPLTGLTTPDAFFEFNGLPPDSLGRACPFGARVVVKGPSFFPNHYYRVQVKRVIDPPTSWTPVKTVLKLEDFTGTVFTDWGSLNAAGFFAYASPNLNAENLLAEWDTTGDELWEVMLELATAPNDASVIGAVVHRLQLDNTGPEVDINIDSGGNCKDFIEGITINGHFAARDTYFGSYNLGTSPFAAPTGQLVPSSGVVQTAPVPGNPWSINTSGMQPCGYVALVTATDRAIINSASVGHSSSKAVGFCLREKL